MNFGPNGRTACPANARPEGDTIELIVSELVTNAVQASMGRDERPRYTADTGLACIHLRLLTDRVAALVEVGDENSGR